MQSPDLPKCSQMVLLPWAGSVAVVEAAESYVREPRHVSARRIFG